MGKYLDLYNAHEGTSQRTRLDQNLLPDNFKIDGRTSIDLVRFAIEFSKSLNYYNVNDSITQSWEEFFIRERIIFLYIIANTNLYETQKSFYQSFEFISNLTDKGDISSHLHLLTEPFHEILDLLASWNSNLDLAEMESEDFINIPRYLLKEDVVKSIREAHRISRKLTPETRWESIDRSFSLNLASEPDNEFDEFDLDDIKSAFEEIFLLAKQVIHKANETVSGNKVENQNVIPHVALFLGFLKIYGILRERLNNITAKHLDFYYQEVLKISRRGWIPDEAFVRFELNQGHRSHYLEEGTALLGGKDHEGEPVLYKTIRGTRLTDAKIAGLQTYFVSQNKLNYTGLGDKDVVTDIFYKKHDPANIGTMRIFGEDQFFKASAERTMETAQVGFIIASDHLQLSEGERKICIDIMSTEPGYQTFKGLITEIDRNERSDKGNEDYTFSQIFRTAFDLYIVLDGTERKYERFNIVDNPEINGITVEINVPADEPPINRLKSGNFPNQPSIDTPYLKLVLREESHIYVFPLIHELAIVNIRLRITVQGMKNFLLFNNYGQIDDSSPFQLFGAIPKVSSYLLLGSSELFSKSVKRISVELNWFQLPADPDGWTGYFDDYGENIQNSDYQVEVTYLNSGVWKKLKQKSVYPLFEEEIRDQARLKKLSGRTLFQDLQLPVDPAESGDGRNFQPYNQKARSGYLKFELISPEFAFGYSAYYDNLFKSISKTAKLADNSDIRQPNPPLSPVLKNISVNYHAEVEAISEKGPGNSIRLISFGPVGYKERELKSGEKPVRLLLVYKPEGYLLIGLDKYPQDGIISFYFKTKMSNFDPYLLNAPNPEWQYLANDYWEDMPEDAIQFDNTNGLVQSGIISMEIPATISNNNKLTNDHLYWIKASVDRNALIFPDVVGIYTNVAQVRWDGKSDGSHLNKRLPGNQISKMNSLDPKIAGIEQVSELFHGKLEETKENYYVRVSERLRHKNRSSTNWDYERLVLEKFPFVFKVKCFNAVSSPERDTDPGKYITPGNVLIVVTPDNTNPNVTDKLQPRFGIGVLNRIRDYLQGLSSPFVNIDVRNPYYELLQVICQVKFKGNLNPGHYISKLNEDLVGYFAPWVLSTELDEQFGNSHYRSKIMAFVEQRDYVDFVTSFSVIKINTEREKLTLFDTAIKINTRKEELTLIDMTTSKGNISIDNIEIIEPEFPWSILTSVRQHNIRVIPDTDYRSPVPRGIDNMELGFDFIITDNPIK